MAATVKRIEQEIMSLSMEERAFLADRLLSSLDREVITEVDAGWVAEAERRYAEYQAGKRTPVSAKDVLEEADRMLK